MKAPLFSLGDAPQQVGTVDVPQEGPTSNYAPRMLEVNGTLYERTFITGGLSYQECFESFVIS